MQALLAAGQPTKASLCLRVLLESSLEAHKQDVLVLLFLAKAGVQIGSISSLQSALVHARYASNPIPFFLGRVGGVWSCVGGVRVHVRVDFRVHVKSFVMAASAEEEEEEFNKHRPASKTDHLCQSWQ